MTVIAPVKLDDFPAPCKPTGQSQGRHRRLGTGTDQANHRPGRPQTTEQFSEFHFTRRIDAERGAFRGRLGNGLHNFLSGMSQDQGAPGSAEVQQLGTIRRLHPRPLAAYDINRIAPNGIKGPNRTVHTTRNHPLRPVEKLFRCHHRTPLKILSYWLAQ